MLAAGRKGIGDIHIYIYIYRGFLYIYVSQLSGAEFYFQVKQFSLLLSSLMNLRKFSVTSQALQENGRLLLYN